MAVRVGDIEKYLGDLSMKLSGKPPPSSKLPPLLVKVSGKTEILWC